MNTRNSLGLPESCRNQCTTPTCIDLLRMLTDTVVVNQVGDELHAYPPGGHHFEGQSANAILKLAICMARVPSTETPVETHSTL